LAPAASATAGVDAAASTAIPSVRPEELTIPALGVIAQIEPAGVTPAGALQLPSDPAQVSWWASGARPGDATGSVVIAGHVDSAATGLGALARLSDLAPGNLVGVQGEGGSVTYRVTGRRQYLKSQLPATSIFAQDVAARLVLITCSGRFDRATGHYQDNTVVYAVPVNHS
jgi:sortase (surface protein transpeptidase)